MNKKQVIILWISLSILVPVLYFGGETLFHYNRELTELTDAPHGFVPDPIEDQPREYRLKVERQHFIDVFGLVVFEIVSVSGLLIFAFHKQKGNST